MNIADQAIELLYVSTKFVKDNYTPFKSMKEVDILNYLTPSWADGTFSFVMVRDRMVAFYEYWLITDEYLKKLDNASKAGEGFIVPELEDRRGIIPFAPLAVIHKDFLGRGFGLTRIVAEDLSLRNPEYSGIYRWVLNEGRLGYIPFRKEDKNGNRDLSGHISSAGNSRSIAGK